MSGQFSTNKDLGKNGWAPSSVMIFHNEDVRTSMHFNPLEPRRNSDAMWRVQMRVYGKNPLTPIYEEESSAITGGEQYEMTSDELAEKLNLGEMMHYAEFHPYSLDITPVHEQIVTPVFAHYTSLSGAFEAHVPSMYIYGSSRSYKMKSRFRYENFPCVEIGGCFELRVYVMNPNLRKATYWVRIVTARGERQIDFGPYSVRPKGVAAWHDENLMRALAFQPAGVILKSDLKLSFFVGSYNTSTQKMTGLDHTHPFFPPT